MQGMLDMAETETLSNTNLQITPDSCASCLPSETASQKQGVNGIFSAHLDGNLKSISDTSSGEDLPIDGNKLPQVPNNLKSTVKSFINVFTVDDIDSNTLVETHAGTLEQSIEANLLGIQQQLDIFSEEEIALQAFSDVKDSSSTTENVIIPELELQNANEVVSQIIDELSAIPISTAQTNITIKKPVQIDSLGSTVASIENQRILSALTQAVRTDFQQNLLSSSEIEAEEPAVFSAVQKIDTSENTSVKLNDFITKYLSEDNASRAFLKNQAIDIFQQSINSFKSEASLQNINIGSMVDAYVNLNVGVSQPKSIEAPIPLLIKQGVGAEQVQQSIDQSIAQNVKWLIGNKAQNAKINVFPESLGQVNIALNLEDSNLKLNFIASSSVTKELIEASVSTLRNYFNESGINLQEVNVETRFSSETEQDSQFSNLNDQGLSNSSNDSSVSVHEEIEVLMHGPNNISTPICLLDAYA